MTEQLRFVALDSSQLGNLSRDHASPKPEIRRAAAAIDEALLDASAIPLLCWHHILELIQHDNPATVSTRLSYLRTRPALAWIKPIDGSDGIGSVVDVLGAELRAATSSGCDAIGVRNRARADLIRVGSGAEALMPFEGHWSTYRAMAKYHKDHASAVVAASKGAVTDVRHLKIRELGNLPKRSKPEFDAAIRQMRGTLAEDIVTNGGEQPKDANGISAWFFEKVGREAEMLYSGGDDPHGEYLRQLGVRDEDIDEHTTVGDVGRLLVFRGKVEKAMTAAGLADENLLSKSNMERLPAWIIDNALDEHGQKRSRYRGSDQADRFIASLAPYAALTFVDGRTHQDFMHARKTVAPLARLIGRIEPSRDYAHARTAITFLA